MVKKFVWVAFTLVFCACLQHAFAMGELMIVTKETQAKLGLKYTLVADRVDDEAVLVSIEIPRKGKLKTLRSVSMRIGNGRPKVSAVLQTTAGKSGAWTAAFQVSPDLAESCYIDLIVPSPQSGMEYVVYAVELKGYVKARK
ncbi:MAG: hypothetical protein NT023_20820 [Armatimonadetes bacterium]|nr:hypothetical protein [Armatimonadota bacterium]